ncbi:gas vesicle protein GvpO [Chloroflexota bacterium]
MVDAIEAGKIAKEVIGKLTELEFDGVRGLSNNDGKWLVTVELIERKSIPDAQDLLGGYEITIDEEEGNILGFERKTLRKRGDTELKEL